MTDPFDTVKEWREQFIAVTDPLDVWLCIDGNYVRPATKQESEMLTALASIEERLREAERLVLRGQTREAETMAMERRAEAAERERDELREAIASALTSLATGPAKDGYAYAVLFTASGKDKP